MLTVTDEVPSKSNEDEKYVDIVSLNTVEIDPAATHQKSEGEAKERCSRETGKRILSKAGESVRPTLSSGEEYDSQTDRDVSNIFRKSFGKSMGPKELR